MENLDRHSDRASPAGPDLSHGRRDYRARRGRRDYRARRGCRASRDRRVRRD